MKILVALMIAASAAHADPVVLAVDKDAVFIDLGAKDGVGTGSTLELLHEVVAKDPRTGAVLRDHFALGTIVVEKSGLHVSLAHASDPEVGKRILAGDRVRLISSKRAFVDSWADDVEASKGGPPPVVDNTNPQVTQTPPTPPGTTPIDHTTPVREAWNETLGKPLEVRILRWQKFQKDFPQSPYHKVVDVEIANLTAQADRRRVALAAAAINTPSREGRIRSLVDQLSISLERRNGPLLEPAIDRALPGQAIELAFGVRDEPDQPVWLYVKPPGAQGYSRNELHGDGDMYLRGTVAAELVKPGRLDWYVAIGDRAVIGSEIQPRSIDIDPIAIEAPIEPNRTHIDGHVDFVDFDGGFNKGYDQYTQAELDFTYRFLAEVYAFRLGFGTLTGVGGPKDVIDEDMSRSCKDAMGVYQCRRLTFSYVYTELEFKLSSNVSLMLRPQAGVLTSDTMDRGNHCGNSSDVTGCEIGTKAGFRGRIRFGSETSTNLAIGAAFTDKVGTLLEAAYHWLAKPTVPIQVTLQVTDMPVVEDFGVRLILDAGWRKYAAFYPSARVSYQARDIDHSGLSGGLALNFDW